MLAFGWNSRRESRRLRKLPVSSARRINGSGNPHRHDDVGVVVGEALRLLGLSDALAVLVLELEEHVRRVDRREEIGDVSRVQSDVERLTGVLDGNGLARVAELGVGRGDRELAWGEIE